MQKGFLFSPLIIQRFLCSDRGSVTLRSNMKISTIFEKKKKMFTKEVYFCGCLHTLLLIA